MAWLQEFKRFALRGNVVDMAVGVVIGSVFGHMVNSLVNDILMPPLGFLLNGVDFSQMVFRLHVPGTHSPPVEIRHGAFITTLVNFLLVSGAIFLVVKLMVRLHLSHIDQTLTQRDCPECLMAIPEKAKRCGHCGSELT